MNILIVDDLRTNRMIIGIILKNEGHVVYESTNGLDALDCLSKNIIDLVFMDIEMPIMNGIETTVFIRGMENAISEIPIIAITSHSPEEFDKNFKKYGFNAHMTRPFTREKVIQFTETKY